MRQKQISAKILSLFLLVTTLSFSQAVVNTSGATISNPNFVFEYSIGEIAISTHLSNDNILTQGLLQPNLKIITPSCDIIKADLLSFENPTRDKIRIVGRYDWITDYHIYASDGKLVRVSKFTNNLIDVSTLPAAVYFIRLLPGCSENNFRVLKVIKQ